MTVSAVRFDGSRAAASAIVSWVSESAPDIPVRLRIEYSGWDDRIGHLEIEIQGQEDHCANGDWVVLTETPHGRSVNLMDDREFRQYFEPAG